MIRIMKETFERKISPEIRNGSVKRNGAGVYIKQGESVSPDLLVMLSLAHVIKMVGYHIWSDE